MFHALKKIFELDAALPTVSWLDDELHKIQFTPDMPLLEQRYFQLVFEHGELQPKHEYFSEVFDGCAAPCGVTFTKDKFCCFEQTLGTASFPIALDADDGKNKAEVLPIKGQLLAVASHRMSVLDTHRLNGVAFKRRRVKLVYPYSKRVWHKECQGLVYVPMEPEIIHAWMYVGVREYWKPFLGFPGATAATTKFKSIKTGLVSTLKEADIFGDAEARFPQYYEFIKKKNAPTE